MNCFSPLFKIISVLGFPALMFTAPPAFGVSPASCSEAGIFMDSLPPSTAIWDSLLQKHVDDDGRVDYRAFKADQPALDSFLQLLSTHPPLPEWPKEEQMAFWINAYNAFTIDLILDHYPVSSIMRLDGGKTWDVRRIPIGGKKYSLNQIENDILRPRFKDPRIHFAINCAARSCPPLLNRAYTAAQLDSLLDARTRAFINNSAYNSLGAKSVKISRIFEWYAADFGGVIGFLNRYSDKKIRSSAVVQYQEYDWGLNAW